MAAKIAVGIAGWSYPDWDGIVYLDRKQDPLAYVSRFVDVIEINSSFYRAPSLRNSESWLRRTSDLPDFYFTAKLHQDMTHGGRVESELVRQFQEGFAPLWQANRLRHLLAQFRYDFADGPEHRDLLTRISDALGETFSLVVEVRHKSWQQDEALKFLERLGVAVCHLDYPMSWNSFNLAVCPIGQAGYFRLHGRNAEKWFSKASRDETYDYYYNDVELQQVHTRIEQMSQEFAKLTVIMNNHFRGSELANALELKARISGQKQTVPEGLLQHYPQLKRIASNG